MDKHKRPLEMLADGAFAEYYAAVCARLQALGCDRKPDRDAVAEDYAMRHSVNESAQMFLTEWGVEALGK